MTGLAISGLADCNCQTFRPLSMPDQPQSPISHESSPRPHSFKLPSFPVIKLKFPRKSLHVRSSSLLSKLPTSRSNARVFVVRASLSPHRELHLIPQVSGGTRRLISSAQSLIAFLRGLASAYPRPSSTFSTIPFSQRELSSAQPLNFNTPWRAIPRRTLVTLPTLSTT